MHVVLYEPDIPWNTGNVGRTCLATGSTLHLVGRKGFIISDAKLKRAGLDYWNRVRLVEHADWDAFRHAIPAGASMIFFSKKGRLDYDEAPYRPDSYLIFGCETKGLPDWILEAFEDRVYRIPMVADSVRSLNLSTAVGVALFEAIRQTRPIYDRHPAQAC